MSSSSNPPALQVHLEEYKVVFTHVIERVKLRHTMLRYAVALLVALTAAAWKIHESNLPPWLLLLLPAPFCLVGGLLVENDLIISGLVNYHCHRLRKLIADAAAVSAEGVMDFESHLFHIRQWRPYRWFASARFGFLVILPIAGPLVLFWQKKPAGLELLLGIAVSLGYIGFVGFILRLIATGQITNPPNLPRFLAPSIASDGGVKERPWEPAARTADSP